VLCLCVTDQVKIAERVQLNEIPLPDMPAEPGESSLAYPASYILIILIVVYAIWISVKQLLQSLKREKKGLTFNVILFIRLRQ